MLTKNMCSEIAVQKILRQFGVPRSANLLSVLKRCESLEHMQRCTEKILDIFDLQHNVSCKILPVSFEFLKKHASPSNPIAIRVVNTIAEKQNLHTVNIVNYDRSSDTYIYDEQDIQVPSRSKLYQISSKDLAKWRHSDYGFFCKEIF